VLAILVPAEQEDKNRKRTGSKELDTRFKISSARMTQICRRFDYYKKHGLRFPKNSLKKTKPATRAGSILYVSGRQTQPVYVKTMFIKIIALL